MARLGSLATPAPGGRTAKATEMLVGSGPRRSRMHHQDGDRHDTTTASTPPSDFFQQPPVFQGCKGPPSATLSAA